MSYKATDAVLANSKSTGTDRLVLLILATHAHEETLECYPGRDLLCKEAAMSERNLIRCLNELEKLGELTLVRGNGRGRGTSYRINLTVTERVTSTTPFISAERVTDSALKVTGATPFRVEKGDKSGNERVTDLVERVTDLVIKGDTKLDMYRTIMNQEETIMVEPKKDMSSSNGLVQEIFAYWQIRLNHPQAKLTPKRKHLIESRLKQKYTVEQIKTAIDGCASSPFHMGANQQGTVYDDIELICRSGEKLESFIARKNSNGQTFVTHKETHNERAARETDELIRRSLTSASGSDSLDSIDPIETWLAVDFRRLGITDGSDSLGIGAEDGS